MKIQLASEALTEAELIIENYQRLLSYELELRSLNLSLEESQALIPEAELQTQGFAMIYDDTLLQQAN